MGRFAMRARTAAPTADSEASDRLSERVRTGLPPRFVAVGEALASGSGSAEACAVAGAAMAKDGASLDETLEALGSTYQSVLGVDPTFADVRAVGRAWSDATLSYLHQLACEDPLTGLASLAHVRSRLSELYRGELRSQDRVRETHALVIAEVWHEVPAEPVASTSRRELSRSLRMTSLGEAARTVFAGGETIGKLGPERIVIVAERDDRLGQRVALLRRMARTVLGPASSARVWIEGLPGADSTAALLLDELAR